eukprot:CAMPEP_0194315150 /NCGR_PEP_ID=MMETSP0171-20130528/11959_1 /TAXON_ID=218684 /ORGANISM="Corethron pennatum, Strain L29A3" /LENGTH=45 /DNA_ID= /DNA_START= /DNA_END= /DNA_ORIENTATION=
MEARGAVDPWISDRVAVIVFSRKLKGRKEGFDYVGTASSFKVGLR